MNPLKILLLACLFITQLSYGQSSPKYSRVKIYDQRPNLISILNTNNFEIDHFHRDYEGNVSIEIPAQLTTVLNSLGIEHSIVIKDIGAEMDRIASFNTQRNMSKCGLQNYSDGSMNDYHTYDDMVSDIKKMEDLFPSLVKIMEIGTTVEGRTIYAVKISDNVIEDESAEEASVYFDALTHARESMGLETTLYYMWYLLENYGTEIESTYLVNHRALYFVPVVNPDGYVFNQMTNPNGGGLWRKNRKVEGNCIGVDLNRNFSHGWGISQGSSGSPCSNIYRGVEAFSEPETQAIRDFVATLDAKSGFSCHTFSDVFLCPNGFNDSLDQYKDYARFASECIPTTYNGYGNWIQMLNYYGAGTTHDYLHKEGTIAYTPEIGHAFWENPNVICQRVQEMLPAMKMMSWVAGSYPSYHHVALGLRKTIGEGYTFDLEVGIQNKGLSMTAKDVTVELVSDNSSVVVQTPVKSFGSMLPGDLKDNADAPFEISITDEITANEYLPFEVRVYQEGALIDNDRFFLYGGGQEILFVENGEQGLDQWAIEGNSEWKPTTMDAYEGQFSITDSDLGNLSSNVKSSLIMSEPIDLSEVEDPFLEFNAKWSLAAPRNYVEVKISTDDGQNWNNLNGLFTESVNGEIGYTYNKYWVQEKMSLDKYIGEPQVKIGFFLTANSSFLSDGFYFDALRIVDYFEIESTTTHDLEPSPIIVYPSPSSDVINVSFNSEELPSLINIIDKRGSVVSKMEVTDYDFSIDISRLDAGLYWLSWRLKNQNYTYPFVKD